MSYYLNKIVFIFFCTILILRVSGGFSLLKADPEKYALMEMDYNEGENSEKESEEKCKDTFETSTDLLHNSSLNILAEANSLKFYKAAQKLNLQVFLSCPYLPPEQSIA